ncbi:MAG: hypothetical protein U0359_05135 [Byssovorax sp.]
MALLALSLGLGCGKDGSKAPTPLDEAPQVFKGHHAALLVFDFEGRTLIGPDEPSEHAAIERQLLYSIGQLNGAGGVSAPVSARLDRIERGEPRGDGSVEIRYHAELPVAWPAEHEIPETYRLRLPLRADAAGEGWLAATSSPACFDGQSESGLWYEIRPDRPGCRFLVPMVEAVAAVSPGPTHALGRYPEIDRIWEDGALDVLAIFRKDNPGPASAADVGRVAFMGFVNAARAALGPEAVVVATPERGAAGAPPGMGATDITLSRRYPDGRAVHIVVLLEDAVAPPSRIDLVPRYARFLQRYAELGPTADIVLYNGHSGLGDNVRAIADASSSLPGKYQLFYMDACDSFAYMTGDLAHRRAARTPEDPLGSRHLDVLLHAAPVTFAGMPTAAMAIVFAMLPDRAPLPYDEILAGFERGRIGFVMGDEDNAYHPSRGLPPLPFLAHHGELDGERPLTVTTEELPAGAHAFVLGADWAKGGRRGALSLEARVSDGGAPSEPVRCERSSSGLAPGASRCLVRLDAPASVTLSLRGDRGSAFSLHGFTRND